MTHLNLWERQHGKIPHGAFVILRSGWDEFYGKRDKFFGLFDDEEHQVFPGKFFCVTICRLGQNGFCE